MNLYLAVRGPKAPPQWNNKWKDNILTEFVTSDGVISHCENERLKNKWVFIHRTAKGYQSPLIIAKAKIEKIINNKVYFKNWVPMSKSPPRRFRGGKCYYDAYV